MFARALFPLFALSSAACGGFGTVNLSVSLSNNNERDILVDFNAEQRLFRVDNVIVILEEVSLTGRGDAALVSALTPVVFRFEPSVEVASTTIEVGAFDGLSLTLGIADALTAANAEEANVFGRSFHVEGTIDADGDGLVETGIVVYAPAAQTTSLLQKFRAKPEGTTVELVLDLEALLSGVNFNLAENTGTELALTEDNAVDQTPLISANVPRAFSLETQP